MSDYPLIPTGARRFRGWPLVTLGTVWQQEAPGVWRRTLLRKYQETGAIDTSLVVHVAPSPNGQFAFCMRCLGQPVDVAFTGNPIQLWFVCRSCKNEDGTPFTFRFVH